MGIIKHYDDERVGQKEFYERFLPVIDSSITVDDVFEFYTDGVLKGNIIEFKKMINDLNTVLFQAIHYLSHMRIQGKRVPRNIILISLNNAKAYVYDSGDYLKSIEMVYAGGASTNVSGFSANKPKYILDYTTSDEDENTLIDILKQEHYTKIHIDEDCIVGWAKTYYKENPTARKSDFLGEETGKVKIIGEIRNPNKLKDVIYPYTGKTNIKFKYLMDKLNDDIQKKNLGAFYTPEKYVDKAIELLREAIKRVPQENDYIILDRCAGTGNLEALLTDEELSHVICSTVEYYEYKVLIERLGDKVRRIIPPTEKEDTFNMGLVRGADALSSEYINNSYIKKYIDDDKCTVIMFENPPYAETTSIEHQRKKVSKKSSTWKNSFVVSEMKKEVGGAVSNDLGNAFIWSAFKYYLRQPTDSYVVFSPVKYWKIQNLVNKKFIRGFAVNRKFFHTNIDACIMIALWANEDDKTTDAIKLEAYNIDNNGECVFDGILDVKKIYKYYSKVYYDKRAFDDDMTNGIFTGLDGSEASDEVKKRITPIYNHNMIGYMVVDSCGFDNPDLHSSLAVAGRYNGNGFFLRRDNYLEKLPMFAASRYITYNRAWTERARIMKSADGAERFYKDANNGKISQFLLKCLLFTCLEMQNHMKTLIGSDGREYRNELCLDTTNGQTIASLDLNGLNVNDAEKELLDNWNYILQLAKTTKEYDPSKTYGVYQIFSELNTYYKDDNDETIFNYPELNGALKTLKVNLRNYYNSEIVPILFDYEFLK